ncbi:MAG: hypothetical protein M3P40_03550 [Actinomycetota bacterium]|nr:hypothetical protein [Actinomycetota bacterium]
MEHNDARPGSQDDISQLEQRADALGKHIEQAREANEDAQPASDLPVGVGDFNDDSSDGPGGEGVTPETNYTTRGD